MKNSFVFVEFNPRFCEEKMNRYKRVVKPREKTHYNENEIRVTTHGRMSGYVTYANSLLKEKGLNQIVFMAMARAMNKTVLIVELMKRKNPEFHQNTVIGSTDIIDSWEPLEEGLLPMETTRRVSTITITLSKQEIDMSSVGYQPPLPADPVIPYAEYDNEGESYPAGRGRGRGGRSRGSGRGNGPVIVANGDGGGDIGRGGSSRGRGRGGRGRLDSQQEANGYSEEPPAPLNRRTRRRGGRGRGDAKPDGLINADAAEA